MKYQLQPGANVRGFPGRGLLRPGDVIELDAIPEGVSKAITDRLKPFDPNAKPPRPAQAQLVLALGAILGCGEGAELDDVLDAALGRLRDVDRVLAERDEVLESLEQRLEQEAERLKQEAERLKRELKAATDELDSLRPGDDLDGLSLAELINLAEERGLDLSGVDKRRKAGVLGALRAQPTG